MQEQLHAPLRLPDDETVVQSAVEATERAKVCNPKREVTNSRPHLTKETEMLLRVRLRAAALMLLIGFGLFLVRHVVGVLTGEPLFRGLIGVHALVVIVLSLVAGPMWGYWDASIKRPRIAELIVPGCSIAEITILSFLKRGVVFRPATANQGEESSGRVTVLETWLDPGGVTRLSPRTPRNPSEKMLDQAVRSQRMKVLDRDLLNWSSCHCQQWHRFAHLSSTIAVLLSAAGLTHVPDSECLMQPTVAIEHGSR